MLGKLFKYDMKALSRTLVPLHVAVLVLGLVGGIGAIVASSATIYWGSVTFDYDVFTFFMSAASWVLLLGGAAICYALCVHLLKRRIELT